MLITRINVQSTKIGGKLRLKTIPICLQSLMRCSSQVCLTLHQVTMSGNVEMK